MRWFREHARLIIILLIVVLIAATAAISYVSNLDEEPGGNGAQGKLSFIQEPLSKIGNGISNGVSGIFRFRTVLKENEELQGEIAELNREIVNIKLKEAELEELRVLSLLLNYETIVQDYDYVTANVTAIDGANMFNTFIIDVGSDDGVKKNSAVLSGEGIVGRISEVGDTWSKVSAIIDESTSVSFRVSRDMSLLGVVSGDGSGGMKGYMLEQDASVIEGDTIITSNLGIYAPGILIGKITKVTGDSENLLKSIEVEPAVELKKIQRVMVITRK